MQVTARNIPVIVSSAQQVMLMGAAACQVKDFEGQDLGPEFAAVVANLRAEDKLIVVAHGLREAVGEKHFAAIVSHEEGHCVLGHLEALQTTQQVVTLDGMEIIVSEKFEKEADAYAAAVHGAEEMISALKGSIAFVIDTLMSLTNQTCEEVRATFTAEAAKSIEYRIAALEGIAA